MLPQTVVLLLSPALASAKLWGWPDDFSIDERQGQSHYPPSEASPNFGYMCEGFGDWCNWDKCRQMQAFQISGNRLGGNYMFLQMENAAWVDLWKVGDSETYNMYEQSGDGTVHGQCEIAENFVGCKEGWNYTVWVYVRLHCWQW